jgi:hypothetical protein
MQIHKQHMIRSFVKANYAFSRKGKYRGIAEMQICTITDLQMCELGQIRDRGRRIMVITERIFGSKEMENGLIRGVVSTRIRKSARDGRTVLPAFAGLALAQRPAARTV